MLLLDIVQGGGTGRRLVAPWRIYRIGSPIGHEHEQNLNLKLQLNILLRVNLLDCWHFRAVTIIMCFVLAFLLAKGDGSISRFRIGNDLPKSGSERFASSVRHDHHTLRFQRYKILILSLLVLELRRPYGGPYQYRYLNHGIWESRQRIPVCLWSRRNPSFGFLFDDSPRWGPSPQRRR